MIDISIDMLSLGNADSIIVWLKDHNKNNFVILIDGGNKSDGEKVIAHLEKYILPHVNQSAPDLVICTHHDKDHIGGLITVVEHYGNKIDKVWINNPAEHISSQAYQLLKESFKKKSASKQYQVILESLTNLDDFISLVDGKKIPRDHALYGQGLFDGVIKVLGPSDGFYKSLLPGMENMDRYVSSEADYAYNSIFGTAIINENLEANSPCPIVDEENSTSATNNSSVILEISAKENSRYIFTGDAGVQAFEDVETRDSLEDVHWLDVPHHGSRRNLTSRLIDTMSPKVCYISAKGGTKHPRRALVNCLKKHGAKVYCTKDGNNMWHHRGDFPDRQDYSSMNPM
jgi:beta-lactamase superfamily II metal-dependent hydrolase